MPQGPARFHLDWSLIEKYDRPGPRYTSYPTALQFKEVDDPAPFLSDCAEPGAPLSLYFHLPFCESLCWFCACAKEITKDTTKADRYLDALGRELELFKPHLGPERVVEQIHYGGGSPSFLTPAQLRRACALWRERFRVADDAEVSVEIDPRTLDEAKVEAFRETGFHRASFGVQDVDPAVQEAIHRIQPSAMNRRAIGWLRQAGFRSLNVDLIYGLPRQSVQSFERTLDEVLDYAPDRFAIFSYAHVPWVAPAQRILERATLPSPREKLAMLERIIERLTGAGYRYIGMDHFAREDDELSRAQRDGTLHRNFQGYSTRAGREIAGFGMSAISQTKGTFRQNEKSLDSYYAALEAGRLPIIRGYELTPEDQLRRATIMEVMCHGRLDYAAMSERLGIHFSDHFAAELASLAPLEEDGLIERKDGCLEVKAPGWLLLRNVAMHFDAYLQTGERRHAKTI
ncbi:MAG: oxygen-independent coproporphyrinogen III oxidase [Verrucomicrobiota bacterium]